MKRVILDTNIYGKIIEEMNLDLILENLSKSNIVIYGNDVIRKELRDTPKEKIMISQNKKVKIRIMLLNTYDFLVKEHSLKTTESAMKLAETYYIAYKNLGGSRVIKEMANDFIIVATATLSNLSIVYSEDNKTMCSGEALKSYELVNRIKELKTPEFKSYEGFRNEINKK